MNVKGRQRKPWTEHEIMIRNKMREQGKTWVEIAEYLGRNPKTVASHANFIGSTGRRLASIPHDPVIEIPPPVLEARERRLQLDYADFTACFCGDPLPGYSALDKLKR